jgi:hypothetical protein
MSKVAITSALWRAFILFNELWRIKSCLCSTLYSEKVIFARRVAILVSERFFVTACSVVYGLPGLAFGLLSE